MRRRWSAGSCIGFGCCCDIDYFWRRQLPAPKVSNYVQLTRDGEPKTLEATDGLRLYLGLGTQPPCGRRKYPSRVAIRFPIPTPSEGLNPLSVSPDGAELLAIDKPGDLWSLPTIGGSPHRLAKTIALDPFGSDAAWSPDGKMLVYCNRGDLYLAKSDGTEARSLFRSGSTLCSPAFSRRNEDQVQRG